MLFKKHTLYVNNINTEEIKVGKLITIGKEKYVLIDIVSISNQPRLRRTKFVVILQNAGYVSPIKFIDKYDFETIAEAHYTSHDIRKNNVDRVGDIISQTHEGEIFFFRINNILGYSSKEDDSVDMTLGISLIKPWSYDIIHKSVLSNGSKYMSVIKKPS